MGSPPPRPSAGSWPTDDSSSYSGSNDGVPPGLVLIVGIGFLSVLISSVGALALFGEGHSGLETAMVVAIGIESVLLVGLLRLRFWAFAVSLVFYSISAVIDLVTFDVIGPLISAIIILYLISISNRFD